MSDLIFAIRHLRTGLFQQFDRRARAVNGNHFILRAVRNKNIFTRQRFLRN
jgi:hypothetical protein